MKIQSGYQILSKTLRNVTNVLTYCTNSNAATSVNWGSVYSATLSANLGFSMTGASVIVTMGGVNVTESVYNNGVVSIPKVTGDIVITAEAFDIGRPEVAVTLTSQTTFDWVASDNIGVTHYAINTTGETPTTWTEGSSGSYTVTSEGVIYIFAKDAAGNIGRSSAISTYSATNYLTNASSSNNTNLALVGYNYTATITPNVGYEIDSAVVTMGGVDVTSAVYNNGVINIASVTGNISISVNAVENTKVLGVSWVNDESTTMTRTDDAVNMSYTIDTTTGKIASDFDSVFPYNQMKRTTIDGNVFVYVPSMWFRVSKDQDGRITGVAVSKVEGQSGDWYQTRAFYYGAYGASSDGIVLKSISGVTRLSDITRATARTRAMAVGTGYHQKDLYADTILMFLWWIEYATKNSQSVMTGVFTDYDNPYAVPTGGTDNIYNETQGINFCVSGYNTSNYQMVWHGIEDLYANLFEWEDGITSIGYPDTTQYVSDDYTKYDDYSNGSQMNLYGYGVPQNSGGHCLLAVSWDDNNPFLVLPIETRRDNNCETAFCSSVWNIYDANRVTVFRGGYSNAYPDYGISYLMSNNISHTNYGHGCRLMKEI